jgi:cytochrome c-type biogenesis protein CcmF
VFDGLRDVVEPQRTRVVADLRVLDGGSATPLAPGLTFYPNATAGIGAPGIRTTAGDDMYAILAAYDARSRAWATLQVKVIPLVSWLWAGGAVVLVGALIAALPPARRRAAAIGVPVGATSGAK